MKFLDLIRISFRNLFRRKLRTILTIVSMMVGAFLISIMMSVGNGLEDFLISQVTMFSNTKTISMRVDVDGMAFFSFGGGVEEYEETDTPDLKDQTEDGQALDTGDRQITQSDSRQAPQTEMTPSPQEQSMQADSTQNEQSNSEQEQMVEERQLTNEDLEKVRELDHVEVVELQKFIFPEYITTQKDNSEDNNSNDEEDKTTKLKLNLVGLPLELREDVNLAAFNKSFFEEENSILISDSYVEKWGFSRDDILGKKVYINIRRVDNPQESKNFEFVVAGVLEKSLLSQMALVSNDMVDEISAYRFNQTQEEFDEDDSAFEAIVVVDSEENVEEVDRKIEDMGYTSDTYEESIGQIGSIFDIVNYLLSSFGAIALVVASIGIVNTLLMAIYERTREIGVMKAVGSTRRQIGAMFTMEATLLGFFGGLVGLGVGWGFGRLANYVLHEGLQVGNTTLIQGFLADYPQFDVSVFTVDILILVMAVTTGVAFLAGLYPAWRASRLNPIKALRTE
jgi:ABC-type antimicrobial peptide transport system permease subunit